MLRPKRKQHLKSFSFSNNYPTLCFLGLLFACGLGIVWPQGVLTIIAYLGLWAFSYIIISAGTCRYCAYYGKKCPIPFEGSGVPLFFEKKEETFGYAQLLWATVAYGLRVFLPIFFVFRYHLTGWGIAYFLLLTGFWIIHLRLTGCPNCMNTQCPLNPDGSFRTS